MVTACGTAIAGTWYQVNRSAGRQMQCWHLVGGHGDALSLVRRSLVLPWLGAAAGVF
jgi:hypothetical protein